MKNGLKTLIYMIFALQTQKRSETEVMPALASRLMTSIMIPAIRTPRTTALVVFLRSKSSMEAARVPVHAPVPGSGIPTNSINAINAPCFLELAVSYFPAFSPFWRIHLKIPLPCFHVLPQIRIFLANR